VEGERLDEICNIVTGKIQAVPGVSRVVSCLVREEEILGQKVFKVDIKD